MTRSMISRRTFLRGSGVALGLPLLDAMIPAVARAASTHGERRRMVAINVGLGLHLPNIIPEKSGRGYETTPYLKPIEDLRDQFTVISGTSHPEVDGGHLAEKSFLTAAPHPVRASFKNSISLDQYAAEKLGPKTRFGTLALSLTGRGLSWSRSGVALPAHTKPSVVFSQLFLEGSPIEKEKQIQRLKDGQSVLDVVMDKTTGMRRRLGEADRDKLDEYLTSVRETEQLLVQNQAWENKPKPKVDAKPPVDLDDKADIIGRARLMYDMTLLALQTDSTRIVTFFKNTLNIVPQIAGVAQDYHNLSHHGKDPEKIKELAIIESAQMKIFAEFLHKLHATKEGGGSLLDETMVLFGSNLGNASSHSNVNLPIVFAGGGFKHGHHLAFDAEKNAPLAKLFVTMMQRMGIEEDQFASGKGTLPGLEIRN